MAVNADVPIGGRHHDEGGLRLVFVALLVCWMLFPVLQVGVLAQDAVPFVAAARVDADEPRSLYGEGDTEASPAIRDASCPLKPAEVECKEVEFPYLGPPQTVTVMEPISALGDTGSILAMRLLAAGGLVAGFVVLWRRYAGLGPGVQRSLVIAAVVLTPYIYTQSAVGQTASLLFLSACLGLAHTGTDRGAGIAAAVFSGAVLFKVFPAPMLGLALWLRRWRFAAWVVGILLGITVLTVAVVPSFQYREFYESSRVLAETRVASPWNTSVDSLVQLLHEPWRGAGAAFTGFLLLRVSMVGALYWWRLRRADEDLQWVFGWVALLVIHPQIWWHYYIVVVPAAFYLARARGRHEWWFTPVAALAVLAMTVLTDETTLKWLGVGLAVAATGAIAALAVAAPDVPDRDETTEPVSTG